MKPTEDGLNHFLPISIWVFGSKSSGYAEEHSKLPCAVHSLSTTLQVPHTMVWGYTSVGGKMRGGLLSLLLQRKKERNELF